MLGLASKSDPRWIANALCNLDAIIVDHAHCEHKAAITALSFVSKYPDDLELVMQLSALAAEEATHLQQMAKVCSERGLTLGHPERDPYAKQLLALTRDADLDHRVDRLLIGGLIEARSCERLKLLAENLDDPELAALYDDLWRCEAGHHMVFCELAIRQLVQRGGHDEEKARSMMKARWQELAEAEAKIVAALPLRARIH